MGTTETEPPADRVSAEISPGDSAAASPAPAMPMSLRISAVLLVVGLLIEAASMLWLSASAFLVFVFGGGTLVAAGILTYLYSLLQL